MDDPRDTLKTALKTAMKEKDTLTRDVVRSINAAIKQVEIDKQKDLNAEDVVDILMKEAKKRRDTIAELESAGRAEMLADEQAELEVLERFLPKQMTREEIEAVVDEIIAETGATSPKEMGKVMGALMPRVKGKADGKLVNDVVREKLKG